MNKKAIIFGVKGFALTLKEKNLFKKSKPWGIILFSRNIKSISQLKILIDSIKKNSNDKKLPILIDQEGGKVSRLSNIIDLRTFSNSFFAKLYNKDKKIFFSYIKIYINIVSDIFKTVGININTVPVLDIRRKKSHNIIGSRSFSSNVNTVIKLGNIYIDMFKKNKIATVNKHIPGHGLAKTDSHFKTPIIKTKKKELIKKDFKPFKKCNSLFAMTAHVVYSAYDNVNVATHSKNIIKGVIRNHINFKGILISDDISMKSLKHTIENNALQALKAGCNLVLHCNANIIEMRKLAEVIPRIDNFTQKKTSQFYKYLR
jgi:beta-N-acetylhexosaminidase